MDREILFKGFHECQEGADRAFYNGEWHTGEWVHGDLLQDGKGYYGIFEQTPFARQFKVAMETISEYTGICDELQAKIFENDIVLETDTDGSIYSEICYTVVFIHGCFKLKEIGNRVYRDFYLPKGKTRKTVGNKFSNPEYLED